MSTNIRLDGDGVNIATGLESVRVALPAGKKLFRLAVATESGNCHVRLGDDAVVALQTDLLVRSGDSVILDTVSAPGFPGPPVGTGPTHLAAVARGIDGGILNITPVKAS